MIDPQLGYDPNDQFYYGRTLVQELIPLAVDGPMPPAKGPTDGPAPGGDPAEGGNTLAMILDVRRAMADLPFNDLARLYDCVLDNRLVPVEIVDRLVDYLGGVRP